METLLTITDVKLTPASDRDEGTGLLGFIACSVDGKLRLDGLTLRQTADGRLVLSFPFREDRFGERHHFVRPLNDVSRREIERQVLLALGVEMPS